MLAAYAARIDADDPLAGLEVGQLDDPVAPDEQPYGEWATVEVRAASLNHHDLWSLRGVGLTTDQLPMVLGGDAAGVDESGAEVVVHTVLGDETAGGGDETMDPRRNLLSERFNGTLAQRLIVPRRNLVPKPAELSFAEAACLPTAWVTAYRMLTTRGQLPAGGSVLIQGVGGGVATAAIILGQALGARVYATSRDATKGERAAILGATVVDPGGRLPERVDVAIETVGAATLTHSIKSLKPGGRCVIAGATSGHLTELDLRQIFFKQLTITGSMVGTRQELTDLLALLVRTGTRPLIDSTYALSDAAAALSKLDSGDVFGKIVLTVDSRG